MLKDLCVIGLWFWSGLPSFREETVGIRACWPARLSTMHGLLQSPSPQYSHAGPFFWSQKRSLVMIFSPPTYELVTQKQSYCQGLTRLRHWASKFNKWQVQNPQWQNLGGVSLSLSWICLATKAGGLFEKVIFGAKNALEKDWCDVTKF